MNDETRPKRPDLPAIGRALIATLAMTLAAASPPDSPDADHLPARPEMPDPLIALDGTRVTTPDAWTGQRRGEIKGLFEHYMYGASPAAPAAVTARVDREDRTTFGGKATTREITLAFGFDETKIHLLLVVPNARRPGGPAPVFVTANFYGNHTLVNDPAVALPKGWVPPRNGGSKDGHASESARGSQLEAFRVDELIGHGYALATYYCGDIAPDHPGRADGIFKETPGRDWGAIAAWAWGLSRVADYLATDPEIDAKKMAVVGHSRLGKAALLAGAFDDRFAVVIAHQAGCGGSAPSRGTVGESVKRINTSFPHWFNDTFKTFNDRPDRLPFDQNALVALVAPRAVLFSNGTEDTWANPEGQFQVLKAAEPVYKLLGAGSLGADKVPDPGTLIDTKLGYSLRPGKHSTTAEDWAFFLRFTDKHLGRTP